MLKKFCSQFETLYGRRYMTANVHNLLHLADCIRELGPLWAYSCFHFESQNGALKSLVHGTQQVAKQIMASFAYRKNLSAAAAETIPETSVYFTSFEHLFLDHHHVSKQNCMKVNDNIFVMGKPIKGSLSEKEMRILVDHDISNYKAYSRILVHNIKIYSYNSNKNCSVKESNSTIAYYNKHCNIEYGVVQNIIVPKTEGDVSNVLLIVMKLQPHSDFSRTFGGQIPHVLSFFPPCDESELVAITVDSICSPCVYMSFEDDKNKIYVRICISKFIRKRLIYTCMHVHVYMRASLNSP